MLALVLGFVGLFGTVAATAMPMWKVSAFIGANLIVMEELWQGLWMNCFTQADVRMQCKVYDSLLILPAELQAARGFMCVSIVLVAAALFAAGCGTQKSSCCHDNVKGKNITLALAASLFLLSSLTTLVPVSWVGHTIIRNFYNPVVVDSEKRELGSALFVGWATCCVLLITGILLWFSFYRRTSKEEGAYVDDDYVLPPINFKERSVSLNRTPSASHKHHEYV